MKEHWPKRDGARKWLVRLKTERAARERETTLWISDVELFVAGRLRGDPFSRNNQDTNVPNHKSTGPPERAQVDGALPKWPNDVVDEFSKGGPAERGAPL